MWTSYYTVSKKYAPAILTSFYENVCEICTKILSLKLRKLPQFNFNFTCISQCLAVCASRKSLVCACNSPSALTATTLGQQWLFPFALPSAALRTPHAGACVPLWVDCIRTRSIHKLLLSATNTHMLDIYLYMHAVNSLQRAHTHAGKYNEVCVCICMHVFVARRFAAFPTAY